MLINPFFFRQMIIHRLLLAVFFSVENIDMKHGDWRGWKVAVWFSRTGCRMIETTLLSSPGHDGCRTVEVVDEDWRFVLRIWNGGQREIGYV
jgi:hypothetical protein